MGFNESIKTHHLWAFEVTTSVSGTNNESKALDRAAGLLTVFVGLRFFLRDVYSVRYGTVFIESCTTTAQ